MATPNLNKSKDNVSESTEELNETLEHGVNLAEDDEEVYELLAGYTDKDGVTHKEFTMREMTGRDEEAIHKGDVKNNSSKVASLLLSRCITSIGTLTPKSVGAKKWDDIIKSLYVGDQDYMLLQLRKISVGEELEVNHVCPNCKAKLKTTVPIDELEIKPFKGVKSIEFTLPRGYKDKHGEVHKTGTMRLPNGLDREILTPLAKSNLARAETVMLTRLCKFSDDMPIDESVMGDLSIRDREYLQKLLQEHNFGVSLETEVTCDSCGETFTGAFNATNFL